MAAERVYAAIDLKSFYASVECVERGLDPLTANLVVADASRTEKTICLAVSPSLKRFGLPGRCRLFEVVEKAREVKARTGRELTYIVAPPRMRLYMQYSARIYERVYLKYAAPDDIHVYSVDEVFIDLTPYLPVFGVNARELVRRIVADILAETGITATAGIGTNLYLAKVAMDVVAKHVEADADGVRIAALDERSYRELMWDHRPLTDFWRVGKGYARKLEAEGLYTMGDIARCSIGGRGDYYNEELLYKLFGVNAELLIDHAWGWEPCRISDIKAYRPESTSLSVGQVLQGPYPFDKARLIVREMTDSLALDLVAKGLACDQVVLTVGYDIDNLADPAVRRRYRGPVTFDYYGREVPKPAHGSRNLGGYTSSTRRIVEAMVALFDSVVDPELTVRRMYVVANHTRDEEAAKREKAGESVQLDMFTDYEALAHEDAAREAAREKERKQQKVVLAIKEKYGKNAILKGMNLEEGATQRDRNDQVGGHRA